MTMGSVAGERRKYFSFSSKTIKEKESKHFKQIGFQALWKNKNILIRNFISTSFYLTSF